MMSEWATYIEQQRDFGKWLAYATGAYPPIGGAAFVAVGVFSRIEDDTTLRAVASTVPKGARMYVVEPESGENHRSPADMAFILGADPLGECATVLGHWCQVFERRY